MMTREERAKQFMAFDAMKGLQEALRDREEKHSRVEKREIGEEKQAEISEILSQLNKGDVVEIVCYSNFHEVIKKGEITKRNLPYRYIELEQEKIFFTDIYDITVKERKI